MTGLVSPRVAGELDGATARAAALPPLLLMEDASLRLWLALETLLAQDEGLRSSSGPLVALAGGGNNGGDALAVLRHARFAGHQKLAAIVLKAEGSELFQVQLTSLKALGIAVQVWDPGDPSQRSLLSEARLVLDGIAGTGLRGPLEGRAREAVEALNACPSPVLAVDLPSGLSEDFGPGHPLARATWTFSIEPRKACLYYPGAREAVGTVIPLPGVFPADSPTEFEAQLLEEGDLAGLLPRISPKAHKGERGRLGLLGGSLGMVGAPAFALSGALAAGAGLVTFYPDADLYPSLAAGAGPRSLAPAVLKPLPESASDLGRQDAFLLGPGWGRQEAKAGLLAQLLDSDSPLVLDADALRLLSPGALKGRRGRGPLVLTPHPGEFEGLSGIPAQEALANPLKTLVPWAAEHRAWVVLKAQVTWVASPLGSIALFDGREPGLGTAGSGDVLGGLIAGILATLAASQSLPGQAATVDGGFRAACAGVLLHGLAGRRARAKLGWFTASDLGPEAALLAGAP